MTPEEAARRAIACTATGALSGKPKWEWCAGMQVTYVSLGGHPPEIRCLRRLSSDGRTLDKRSHYLVHESAEYDGDPIRDLLPNFRDDVTVLAMLPLVRRAWTGHEISIVWLADGNVRLHVSDRPKVPSIVRFLARNVPLYEALTLALEAAPEKP